MSTPAVVANLIEQRRERARAAVETELAINAHLAYDDTCDHHCTDCCWALHMRDEE